MFASRFFRSFCAILILFLVTACGGGGGGSSDPVIVTAEPQGITRTGTPASTFVTFAANGDLLVNGRLRSSGPVVVTGLPANYTSYSFDVNGDIALYGETPSGEGYAHSSIGAGGNSMFARRTEESTITLLPGGSTDYTGSYAGQYIVRLSGGGTALGHMIGNARLTLDHADQSFSGEITGRQNSGGSPAADVMLSDGDLTDGTFVGVAEGGAFVGGSPGLPGTFAGLLVGPNGEEMIGLVELFHERDDGARITEQGIIVATSP